MLNFWSRDEEPVRESYIMATDTTEVDVNILLEDDYAFSDSLIASTELILGDESIMLTFIPDEDVLEVARGREFPCNLCQRVFRSRNGLNAHNEVDHFSQPNEPYFANDDFTSFVEEVRERLAAEKLYTVDFIERFPHFVPVQLQSFVNNLISSDLLVGKHRHDYDRSYTKYSIVFSKTLEYFPNFRVEVGNFFLLQLGKTILYNVKRKLEHNSGRHEVEHTDLQKEERGPLAFVAGSVLRMLYRKAAFHKRNGPWQEEIKSLFSKTLRADSHENAFVASRDRGGLWAPSVKVTHIFEIVERIFRKLVVSTSRSSPIHEIKQSCLANSTITSVWNSIIRTIQSRSMLSAINSAWKR